MIMKKEDLRFQIDQLRKDKMIYALESIAFTFIMELVYITLSVVLGYSSPSLAIMVCVLPLGYFVFMAIGNTRRFLKIRKLEKQL